MKLIIAIVLSSAVLAFAQTNSTVATNSISTNAVGHKSAPKKVVATKEMVLQGLTTISNQMASLKRNQSALEDQIFLPEQKAQLQYQAGMITGAEANEITDACRHQWAVVGSQTSQQIAVLKLQELEIRQRYAQLLKQTNAVLPAR